MTPLLVALVLQASEPVGRAGYEELEDAARAVRDRAIERLADGDVPTAELVRALGGSRPVALGLCEVLARRGDREALPALARAADEPDAARARAAAAALLAIAVRHDLDLAAVHFEGMTRLPRRLQDEVDRHVAGVIEAALEHRPATDTPQHYRPVFCAGDYGARALEAYAGDPARAGPAREHALYAYALLAGEPVEALATKHLESPEPRLRAASCSMLLNFGQRASHERLARRLDEKRIHPEDEIGLMVSAAERTNIVSENASRRLSTIVVHRSVYRALTAAAALKHTHLATYEAALAKRLGPLLDSDARSPGAAIEAALFELRVGPLPKELRDRMAQSGHPLVRAPALDDPAAAIEALRPMIAPDKPLGARESMRVYIVYQLLRRHDAPVEDRLRFVRDALVSPMASARRYALWTLARLPEDVRAPFRELAWRQLTDKSESVRLAAADVLAPDPVAIRVCIRALYDGNRSALWTVRRVLREVHPDWPRVEPRAPTRERRALARDFVARLAEDQG
ncbi:MAG: hypothetical protein ACYTGN_18085 [Planctomycetota bacterium]